MTFWDFAHAHQGDSMQLLVIVGMLILLAMVNHWIMTTIQMVAVAVSMLCGVAERIIEQKRKE